jgi:superfamily II DNA or RNA helicase
MSLPKIIDNERKQMGETLKELSKTNEYLSIATGYWDLPGTQIIFDDIKDYKSVRLLIGQEPLMPRYKKELKLEAPEQDFPDKDISFDLATLPQDEGYRKLVTDLKGLIADGRLEVRIYRKSFLHAKCYIFGNYESESAVGIIGSSNFTRAGLTSNTELNALEDDYRIVKSSPKAETDDHGHLSWFDTVWNDDQTEQWDGRFSELLGDSPVGDLTYSPYDMYIKTLWELYQDEIVDDEEIAGETVEILYSFQRRNAQLLLKKLNKYGLAMLADSVGLGKTITAGAVLKHYIEEKQCKRIYIIAPASLCAQWKQDLIDKYKLFTGFEVISMQDTNAIQKARAIDKYAPVDMFIIDEAHNLRNDASKRHQELLEWFSDNPESKVLLMTATPINNSLTDFVNQIQLAAKGSLESFPVVYPTSKKNEVIDFFEAVKRLSSEMAKAENKGEKPDFNKVNRIMRQGLRHFLVRTTRKGIEKEFGGLLSNDGTMRRFPVSEVVPSPYNFSDELGSSINNVINNNLEVFAGKDPRTLDVDSLLEQTQRTKHPLDVITGIATTDADYTENVFVNVFQVMLLLGFSPYRSETYQHRFYGKTPAEIKQFKLSPEESFALQSQMSVHNMLRVTFLKRLESSPYALRKSLENYQTKLNYFSEKLEQGYIIRFKDMQAIQSEFGDDLELVIDYNLNAENDDQINLTPADTDKYDVQALKNDIQKDQRILSVIIEICRALEDNDDKLDAFGSLLTEIINKQKAGKKVLVFSYYADTIKYLSEKLPGLISAPNFGQKSAFISGESKSQIEDIVKRFSPVSKTGEQIDEDQQIDYLFATDVLSEGQNLQDCGTLINFDLHWNPVRMIQRNGRINRLGSEYEKVYIFNMHPETNLESYLQLVHRLEQKIDRIKYTVGTDQSVLGEEENPIEYIDEIEENEKQENTVLELYDEEKATEVFSELDDDDDFLSIDEYVLDLRKFLNDATDEDKKRVQDIPVSKWGYLPESAKKDINSPTILSLTRSKGTTTETGVDFETHIFVESDALSGYMVDAVETIEALKHIRTTPDDNKRVADRISYDREQAKKYILALAKRQAVRKNSTFKITPSIKLVLNELANVLPDVSVDVGLEQIVTKQDDKLMRDLFRRANTDLKSHQQLLPNTISGFEKAVKKLAAHVNDEKEVRSVEGVLFYAK